MFCLCLASHRTKNLAQHYHRLALLAISSRKDGLSELEKGRDNRSLEDRRLEEHWRRPGGVMKWEERIKNDGTMRDETGRGGVGDLKSIREKKEEEEERRWNTWKVGQRSGFCIFLEWFKASQPLSKLQASCRWLMFSQPEQQTDHSFWAGVA